MDDFSVDPVRRAPMSYKSIPGPDEETRPAGPIQRTFTQRIIYKVPQICIYFSFKIKIIELKPLQEFFP